MKKENIDRLRILLEEYFEGEFKLYRKTYSIVYDGRHIEEDKPENLFLDMLDKDHPYQALLSKLEYDLMFHIRSVFILQNEHDRFYAEE